MSVPIHPPARALSSPSRPTMASQAASIRRPRPLDVQTNITSHPSHYATSIPASAVSSSTVSSSSHNMSPTLFPDTPGATTNSSIQPSPESSLALASDEQIPYAQLPESIFANKSIPVSSAQPGIGISGSTQDVGPAPKGGIVRRFSNRATNLVTRRRQSSVTPNSREGSVGPAMVRKRSGSTAAVQPDLSHVCAIMTDSDESPEDREETLQAPSGSSREPSLSGSATVSLNGSLSSDMDAPVWPTQLLGGTPLRKVSKKNRCKRIMLVLDPHSGRISWDGSRKKKHISIDEIKEIRTNSDIRQYCRDFDIPESEEGRWFSIIYAAPELHKTKTMHLIADDMGTFKNWTGTLNRIWQYRLDNLTSLMAFDDKAVQRYWKKEVAEQFDKEDWQDEGSLDFQGFERVCRHLHINASPAQLLAKFQAADRANSGRMNYSKFKEVVDILKTRNDVGRIYEKVTRKPEQGLSREEFFTFLQEVQCEDVDRETAKWQAVFAEFADRDGEAAAAEHGGGAMSAASLSRFLTSAYNAPVATASSEPRFDRPMNEYFISSSHNTYLLGWQVIGESSVEGYITALRDGCRCIEVDCWDGSDGQPVVLHGRSMTTSISFQEVMTTIKRYAFVKTQYPLWISLEVHTNPSQQARMATIMKDTFGPLLVTEPLDPTSDKLPSPDDLKGRILLKVKKPNSAWEEPRPADVMGRRRGNSLTSPYIKPLALDNAAISSQSLPQSPQLNPVYTSRRGSGRTKVDPIAEGGTYDGASSSGCSDEESISDLSGNLKLPEKPETGTERVLADLAVYCAGVKFKGFDTPEAKTFNHIFSFMESSFSRYSKPREAKKALDRHNMRYLMRIYPDRTRIKSNNFDPLIYWRRGVQMAALNWQKYDKGMQLNRAMFDGGTDSTGYVLKPSELREIQLMPEDWSGKRERKSVCFNIDVVSAQQLIRPRHLPSNKSVHPYIEVEVFHPNDKRYKNETDGLLATSSDTPLLQRTQIVPENGFNPLFNKNMNFKITTKYPDLVFVRWSVKMSSDGETYNGSTVATFTAKLKNLGEGYRTLPLDNGIGEGYVFSTLFCNIRKYPITSVLLDCPGDLGAAPEASTKRRGLGLNVFNRSSGSPKSTIERGSENLLN